MPFPAMPTQITCPRCGHRFLTQVRSIVDVGEQPELKEELLRGRINAVRCPQCNGGGLLSTPLVYHDPAKELLVTLVPAELNLSAAEQEQIVGELVNAVMNNVPAEQRKSYFFHPKTVLRYESLFETILEADGISREMLEAQRAILKLIDDLADALEDTEALDKLIEENRDKLDYEFFLVLSDVIESYRAESKGAEDEKNVENVRRLETLRSALLERVSPTTPRASGYDELIDLLLKTEPGSAAWRRTVALNRARLDYGFFQRLTGRIEAAQGVDDEKAKTLTELRSRVLDEIQAQDERVERAQDRAGLLIMRL
ncbi:MAG: hypothetical protein H5T69_14285, partial [Chloroflexi bacterium]|nr:hypothetical protein [Chloroflexota bacterium]